MKLSKMNAQLDAFEHELKAQRFALLTDAEKKRFAYRVLSSPLLPLTLSKESLGPLSKFTTYSNANDLALDVARVVSLVEADKLLEHDRHTLRRSLLDMVKEMSDLAMLLRTKTTDDLVPMTAQTLLFWLAQNPSSRIFEESGE